MVYHNKFNTGEEAKRAVFEYIEVWYNRKRIRSALGYLTPCQMEKLPEKTISILLQLQFQKAALGTKQILIV